MKRILTSLLTGFTVTVVGSLATPTAQAVPCHGKVINPVTDVCWSCMFPVTLGVTIEISPEGDAPDVKTDATPFCVCGQDINLEGGLNFSFWEPLRTAEVIRHSWCFPSLGGVSMENDDLFSKDHARMHPVDTPTRTTAFWQVHWYHTPWLFVMEVLLDEGCLEQSAWDLAYLSELDPLWDDTLSSFILAPDAALFTAGAAFGACAVDCMSAMAGVSQETLYWCGGCQGAVFPLSGWMAGMTSPLQAWHLMTHRFSMKLSREGILWSAHGKDGQCGPYVQPLFRKDVWRTQLVYPSRTTSKPCCHPLGRSTMVWGSGKTFPVTGEDGAILLWRKRDCCMTKASVGPDGVAGGGAGGGSGGSSGASAVGKLLTLPGRKAVFGAVERNAEARERVEKRGRTRELSPKPSGFISPPEEEVKGFKHTDRIVERAAERQRRWNEKTERNGESRRAVLPEVAQEEPLGLTDVIPTDLPDGADSAR